MKIIKNPEKVYQLVFKWKRLREKIGFVPTMGALHEGHLLLIRKARKENDRVVVSIFVNPTQFALGEDFRRYPRRLRRDVALCRREGGDIVFVPEIRQMYLEGHQTKIYVEKLDKLWCGKFRPGHFSGVATVVAKLFNIVSPDRAYFGEKDFQQLVLVKRMVSDLNFPVKIVPVKTVREKSGLALSSRNLYLNRDERKAAEKIYSSLELLRDKIVSRKIFPEFVQREFENFLKNLPEFQKVRWKMEYVAVVKEDTLERINSYSELSRINFCARILTAIWVGHTRLIDNISLK